MVPQIRHFKREVGPNRLDHGTTKACEGACILYWDPSGILKRGARKAFGGASAKELRIEVGHNQ